MKALNVRIAYDLCYSSLNHLWICCCTLKTFSWCWPPHQLPPQPPRCRGQCWGCCQLCTGCRRMPQTLGVCWLRLILLDLGLLSSCHYHWKWLSNISKKKNFRKCHLKLTKEIGEDRSNSGGDLLEDFNLEKVGWRLSPVELGIFVEWKL